MSYIMKNILFMVIFHFLPLELYHMNATKFRVSNWHSILELFQIIISFTYCSCHIYNELFTVIFYIFLPLDLYYMNATKFQVSNTGIL